MNDHEADFLFSVLRLFGVLVMAECLLVSSYLGFRMFSARFSVQALSITKC